MAGARKISRRDPEQYTRLSNSTTAFVYVLPCRHEDILKVGFSRDPLVRMQTLHPRYFDYFDVDRALLVGTGSAREARRLEGELAAQAQAHNAPAPLLVRPVAGGHTEWYRGAYPLLQEAARVKAARAGYSLHLPLRPWLYERLSRLAGSLYEPSGQMLRAIESARAYGTVAQTVETALRNRLDACEALGLAITPHVPPEVSRWYVRNRP